MSKLQIIVDSAKDWAPYFSSDQVITFEDYLRQDVPKNGRTRVINLCRSMRYLSKGYYCSLLAEARNHSVIPSVRTLAALRNQQSFAIIQGSLEDLSATLLKKLSPRSDGKIQLRSFFGETSVKELQPLAKELFDHVPCPVLEIELEWQNGWRIDALRPVPLQQLNDEESSAFANALDRFSALIWRKPKLRAASRYDMAILVNPDEKPPPSDEKALKKLERVGEKMGVDVTFIGRRDLRRLSEFDMLFIRETTAIDHHTFDFARRAEAEGVVVMDDAQSIIRCTNKVYMADLFAAKGIPTPRTKLLPRDDPAALAAAVSELGFPLVLKIPDGSFSRGVIRVENQDQLNTSAAELFRQSALLLAQEYLYTDFDWRIGILKGKPLYACKYFMARNHWQIYNHSARRFATGKFTTMPTYEAPKQVIATAVKAAGLIGNGIYGVDVKQTGDRVAVIEVNDNPSIESGVEDAFLGDELYRIILEEFIDRVELRRKG